MVIASLIGARRRAIEKVLGKPLFPAQPEGRVNFQYGLTGSAEVWIIYLDDKPDSEMWSASVALLDGDVTWPDALRTIGYKVDGVRLVGKKLSHVKGAPKGFELLCTRHAIVIINEKKWLQYRQRHKKADKTQNWTSGRGVGLEIPTTRFVLEG